MQGAAGIAGGAAFNAGLLEGADFIGARIDLVVTASRQESDHDGSVVVAGRCYEVAKPVTMAIASPYDSAGASGFADVNGRFLLPAVDNGTLEEGNSSATVLQEDTVSACLVIGLR